MTGKGTNEAVGQCQDEMFTFDLCIAPREHIPRFHASARKRKECKTIIIMGLHAWQSYARVKGDQGQGSCRGGFLGLAHAELAFALSWHMQRPHQIKQIKSGLQI
jgi:hypothetical protein